LILYRNAAWDERRRLKHGAKAGDKISGPPKDFRSEEMGKKWVRLVKVRK
jgi:hypothetical protein